MMSETGNPRGKSHTIPYRGHIPAHMMPGTGGYMPVPGPFFVDNL